MKHDNLSFGLQRDGGDGVEIASGMRGRNGGLSRQAAIARVFAASAGGYRPAIGLLIITVNLERIWIRRKRRAVYAARVNDVGAVVCTATTMKGCLRKVLNAEVSCEVLNALRYVGAQVDDSLKEIRVIYRQRVFDFHPDRNEGKGAHYIVALNHAWVVLKEWDANGRPVRYP